MRTRTTTLALTAGATALATAFGIGAAHAYTDYPITATLSDGTVSVAINNAWPGSDTTCTARLYPTSASVSVTTYVTSFNATTDSNYPDVSTLGTPLGTATSAVLEGGDSTTLNITPTKAASGYSVLVTCLGEPGSPSEASSALVGSSGGSGSSDWTDTTGSTANLWKS